MHTWSAITESFFVSNTMVVGIRKDEPPAHPDALFPRPLEFVVVGVNYRTHSLHNAFLPFSLNWRKTENWLARARERMGGEAEKAEKGSQENEEAKGETSKL